MAQSQSINIIPDESIKSVHVSQGDIGRRLVFNLFEGSTEYYPRDGAVVRIRGTKPSGYGYTAICTLSDNVASVDTTEGMTDEYGNILSELQITVGDTVLGTANFILSVEKNPHPDSVTDASIETAIQIETRMDAIESRMDAVEDAIEALETGDVPDVSIERAERILADANLQAEIDTTNTDLDALELTVSQLNAIGISVEGEALIADTNGETNPVGSPLLAFTVSDMTDSTKIYVYVGSEAGYTYGNWYYYDGSAWVSGGVYNALVVPTDTTLSVSGMPADAKVVGDEVSDLKEDLNYTNEYLNSVIVTPNYADVAEWIDGYYIKATNGSIVAAARYSYQFVPILSAGTYCTFRSNVAFGSQANKLSLHDSDKNYVKTINADSYNTSTGIAVFTITDTDVAKAHYIGLSTIDHNTVNFIKGNIYNTAYTRRIWTIDAEKTKLYNAVLICDGDSIANGAKDFPDNLRGWWSRLIRDKAMTGKNYAVNGATITYLDSTTHCISRNIDTIHDEYESADYLIIDGGTNDADRIGKILNGNVPSGFGAWSETDFAGSYDDTTFCGAVESLFYKALNYYAGAKIGFIIPMQMGGITVSTNSILNRRAYFDEIIKIAKKWHIPVLDLWNESTLDGRLTCFYDQELTGDQNVNAGKYYYDGQHPTSKGYNLIQDKIQKWAEML